MLSSVVLHLQPLREEPISISHYSAVHGAALDLIDKRNAVLADSLHDIDDLHPFTCSPLLAAITCEHDSDTALEHRSNPKTMSYGSIVNLDLDGHSGKKPHMLNPRCIYDWRLTGLTEDISKIWLEISHTKGEILITTLPKKTYSDDQEERPPNFTIVGASTSRDKHPLAGQSSYERLFSYWQNQQQPPRYVTLHVMTPTAFKVGQNTEPLIQPALIFNSLLTKWNMYSRCPLYPAVTRDDSIMLRNWMGQTRLVRLAKYCVAGFIGKFTYKAPDHDPELGKLLGLLADFSFFAGIGCKTAYGLGQSWHPEIAPPTPKPTA